MTRALEVRGVSVSFGAVKALEGVDLDVDESSLVGLIGPNGAGKTTLIDAVTGFVASCGSVALEGREISGLAPHERARLGLGRTWQTIELFDDLTVRENLAVALGRPSLGASLAEVLFGRQSKEVQLAEEALGLLGLDDVAQAMPSELSQGKRKLVGIARSLAARPAMLLLDEPAAGLDTIESHDLGRKLRRLIDTGLSGLLIDHDMGLVLGICDKIYVLDFGRIIATGTPEEIRANPDVLAAYLGTAGSPERTARSSSMASSPDGGTVG